jgi:predicted DCC family thiol-disulfide oxidoreductase YuxK
MKNGWTGGQYSLFRLLFGTYLFFHFAQLVGWSAELFSNQGALQEASDSPLIYLFPNVLAWMDSPAFVTGLVVSAAGLSLLFAVGKWDRLAAVLMWYILACLFGRNPLISNPGLPYVGWMLLAHAFLPRAPYGSWAARNRPDPGADWKMPAGIFTVAWILMAVGYSYSGLTKFVSPSWIDGTAMVRILDNPLARSGVIHDLIRSLPDELLKFGTWGALSFELLFAPLALAPRLRPYIWGGMLLMHLGLMVLIDFADLSLGMVMLHFFTFNPDWIGPKNASGEETVFFDGHCGLCHRWVRFILAEDRAGTQFRFAPLDGETFLKLISEEERNRLPDSIVVRTCDGKFLSRSNAVLHMLQRLGGVWRVIAVISRIIPVGILDWAYDQVAGIRHRLFARPKEACPLVPAELRRRFDS